MDVIDIYDANNGDMDKILELSSVSQRLIKDWVKSFHFLFVACAIQMPIEMLYRLCKVHI